MENNNLEEKISTIYFDEDERVYCTGKIHFSLKLEVEKVGRICSIKRVQRMMRKLNLRSITQKKRKPTVTSKDKIEDRGKLVKSRFFDNRIKSKVGD